MSHVASSRLPTLLLAFALLTAPDSRAQSPQDGQITPEEPAILWERATQDFSKGEFERAAHSLRRLVERIPTHAHALEAQKLLGETELRLRNFEAAQKSFETFLSNTRGRGELSNSVRALLAETHLQAGKPTQALLIADQLNAKGPAGGWKRALDSQIHKVRALIALKQDKRARSALEAARKIPSSQTNDPEWATDWMASLHLQLQSMACTAFAFGKDAMTEDQAIDRLTRHSECLASLKDLRSRFQASATLASVQAIGSFEKARQSFLESCRTPPPPPSPPKGPKRTASELEFYSRELKRKLAEICGPETT